jgi:hypothetical protein
MGLAGGQDERGMLRLEFLDVSFVLRHIPADVILMIVIIGKGGVNFR